MSHSDRSPDPELAEAGDPALDFCLWPYRAGRVTAESLRSANLFWQSLWMADAPAAAAQMCREIQSEVGEFHSVFGVKRVNGRTNWELYFYDYQRYDRRISPNRVLRIAESYLGPMPRLDEDRPTFMFSFEFGPSTFESRSDRSVDVYVGTGGDGVSSGLCYIVEDDQVRLKNVYHFYDARTQVDVAWQRLTESVRFDGRRLEPADVLWSLTTDSDAVVVAHKRNTNGLYFTHLPVERLIDFMLATDPTDPMLQYVTEHRDDLDHLRYDVGLDFDVRSDRTIDIRTAFYGVF